MRRDVNWSDTTTGSSHGGHGPLPQGARVGGPHRGTATVIRVYYRSSDFAAVRLRGDDGVEFSAVGRGTLTGIEPGTRMEIQGTWVRSRYGPQVDIGNVRILSLDQALGYLESLITHCPRWERDEISPILRNIHAIYGETMESSIRDGSALADDRCGVGRLGFRIRNLAEEKRNRDIRMATLAEIHQLGINSVTAELLMVSYGLDAPDIVSTFPYEVAMEVAGIPLRVADNIAKRRGLTYDPDIRMRLLISFALETIMGEGHCFCPRASFITGAAELIRRLDSRVHHDPVELRESVTRAVDTCERNRVIVIDSQDRVYPYICHEAEDTTARNVVIRMGSSSIIGRTRLPLLSTAHGDISAAIELAAETSGMEYSDRQIEAVRSAILNPISIITGGPGTGKTTICRAIVDVFTAAKMTVHLCSPTGRGARRLSESVGRDASTIHRLLEFLPQSGEWRRNSLNQLLCDAIIVDEMSMVDILLLKALLDAMPGVGRIVLVGDHDQLPSVGPGRVLRELMGCGLIPVTILDTIFRQAEGNDIIAVAQQVRHGIVPNLPLLPGDPSAHGCWFVDEGDGELLATRIPGMMMTLAESRGCAASDVQVLTPMRKGPLGTEMLNIQLQEAINPHRRGVRDCVYGGIVFRTGDKISQTRNDHQNEVYNGDIGMVISSQNDGVTVLFDGGQEVHYIGSQLENIEHCLACTIHRAQGSEFPVGIILMHPSHSRMLRRNLLYTGITRCTEQAVIMGRLSAITQAVEDDREQTRCTSLEERIRDFENMMNRPDVREG